MKKPIEGTVEISYLCTYDHVDDGQYQAIRYNQRNRQVPCQFVPGTSETPDTVQFEFSYPWYRIKSYVCVDFAQKTIFMDWPGMDFTEKKSTASDDGGFKVQANLYVQKDPDAFMDMFAITITVPGHRPPDFEEFDLQKLYGELRQKFLEDHPQFA